MQKSTQPNRNTIVWDFFGLCFQHVFLLHVWGRCNGPQSAARCADKRKQVMCTACYLLRLSK